jgi:hypothetical protein
MESVDLGATPHTVQRWWARGSPGELGHAVIGLGRLQAGPWFVAKAEHGTNMAWLARDERHACDVVQQWIVRRGGIAAWPEVSPAAEVASGRLRQ